MNVLVANAELKNFSERFGSAALDVDDKDTAPSGSGWVQSQYRIIGGGDLNDGESAAAR